MPHIVVEYTPSSVQNVPALLQDLHANLADQDTVDQARIKSRAIELHDCVVGLDNKPNDMVHVTLKVLDGRDISLRKKMAMDLQNIVKRYTPDECPVTVEVVELDSESYCA